MAQVAPADDGGIPQFEEELAPRAYAQVMGYPPTERNERGGLRSALTTALIGVEVLAVAGFIGLLVFVAYLLNLLNEDLAEVDVLNQQSADTQATLLAQQVQASPTAIIDISRVVLPGGHIWDANGLHQFNLNEVPGPYRSSFQNLLSAPRGQGPSTRPGGPIRLVIPAINTEASVRNWDDWITLQASVGHGPYSSNPGEQGNMVLVGHNDIFGEVFRRLEEVNPGDEIRVQAEDGLWYTYQVREKQVVDPSEVWVLDQNLGQNTPLVTLITCYPYRVNTHRLVVFAELVNP
jgi:sortase A